MIGLSILGATGSIGVNTLDVVAQHPDRFKIVALSANKNTDLLFAQCMRWSPKYAVLAQEEAAERLALALKKAGRSIKVLSGQQGLCEICRLDDTDFVIAAIVGAAGLPPTLEAARYGKRILLANKEALVMSGDLLTRTASSTQATLLPIDSEHNAIFQCMPPGDPDDCMRLAEVKKIILTASGGPFLHTPLPSLDTVRPDQACKHPNWEMGRKISVDSATMMNKGLEVIEASYLFGMGLDKIEVVIHPQSIIHSLVSYTDGSMLAQLGNPDMRTPITHALAWPDRMPSNVPTLDLCGIGRFDFFMPDEDRFPCLRLAREAMQAGGTATAILNAANECAVERFLAERIRFTDIPIVVEQTLTAISSHDSASLDQILSDDQRARQYAYDLTDRGDKKIH